MRVSKDLILREVAGENILIPVGKAALKIHGMICLSESAAFLFDRLRQECSEAELIDAILAQYDVDRDTAAGDVRDFLEQMQRFGILEKEGAAV